MDTHNQYIMSLSKLKYLMRKNTQNWLASELLGKIDDQPGT